MAELYGIGEVDTSKKETSEEGDPKQETALQLCKKLLQYSKRHRELWDKDWNYNYNFVFGGRQWGPNRPKWRFNEAVNVLWGGIMQEVSIETDTQQQTDFVAEEPSDVPFAEILKQINNRNWEKYNWSQLFTEAKIDSKIVHVVHTEVRWNPKLENGLGDVEHVNLNPWHLWWDPSATCVEDARWIIYAPPTPTAKLKAMYPQHEWIKPDIERIDNLGQYAGLSSPTEDIGLQTGPASTGLEEQAFGGEPMTKWVRVWIRDESAIQEEEVKEDGSKQYVMKKKYPDGRYIEYCNNKIIHDGPIGTEINGEWVPYKFKGILPIARLVNYGYPRRYAGENECTNLKGPQKVMNYAWSYILDTFKSSINPKVVVSHAAGELADEITNEPNQIIEVPNVDQIRFEHPPGLPAGIFNVLDQAKSMMDLVRGTGEISQGRIPANVSSGVFFETMLETEQVRPRLKSRASQVYLRQIGTLDLNFYLQFYKTPRVFRITNKMGFPEYVQFSLSEDEQGNRTADISKMDAQGNPLSQSSVPVKGTPDVRVTIGSALPFAKAIKNQNAKELYTSQAIDREALFDMIDLPNKDAVLKRMQAQEAAMAQQQAAMPQK